MLTLTREQLGLAADLDYLYETNKNADDTTRLDALTAWRWAIDLSQNGEGELKELAQDVLTRAKKLNGGFINGNLRDIAWELPITTASATWVKLDYLQKIVGHNW